MTSVVRPSISRSSADLHQPLALGIERRGRFIEEEDRCVLEQSAGDGERCFWPPDSMTPRSPTTVS